MAELLEPRPGAAGRHVGGNTEEPMGHGEMKSYFDEPSLDYEVTETLIDDGVRVELAQIAARYPQARSALLPMLHLVQSVEGRVTIFDCQRRGRGIH